MAICPVCKSDCSDDKCIICGFEQLNMEFINKDDALAWMNEIVIPYREKHLSNNADFVIEDGVLKEYVGNASIVRIPSQVTRIECWVDWECEDGFETIIIPESVEHIEEAAFLGCKQNKLNRIFVDKGNENYHSSENCLIETETNTLILGCKNSSIIENISRIGEGAFEKCADLKSIVLPNSLKEIGAGAFSECTSLTEVNIPQSVELIDNGAFENCDNLKTVHLNEGLTCIWTLAFARCKSLKEIHIPSTVNSLGVEIFDCCEQLEKIEVTKDNRLFHSCNNCLIETSTRTLLFGCKTSVIPEYITDIGSHAFYVHKMLTHISIPSNVRRIGSYAFGACRGLKYIIIPQTVSVAERCVFHNCAETEIYCEHLERPLLWDDKWDSCCTPALDKPPKVIYWGNEWHYENGKPVLN